MMGNWGLWAPERQSVIKIKRRRLEDLLCQNELKILQNLTTFGSFINRAAQITLSLLLVPSFIQEIVNIVLEYASTDLACDLPENISLESRSRKLQEDITLVTGERPNRAQFTRWH